MSFPPPASIRFTNGISSLWDYGAVVSMSEGSHKSISSLLRTSRHEKLTTPPSWPSARMRGASTSWPDSAPPSK